MVVLLIPSGLALVRLGCSRFHLVKFGIISMAMGQPVLELCITDRKPWAWWNFPCPYLRLNKNATTDQAKGFCKMANIHCSPFVCTPCVLEYNQADWVQSVLMLAVLGHILGLCASTNGFQENWFCSNLGCPDSSQLLLLAQVDMAFAPERSWWG